MSLNYARLSATNWPAMDREIEGFLQDTTVAEIEAMSMGLGETGNPELRMFYREGA